MQNAAAFHEKCWNCLFRSKHPINDSGPSMFVDTCSRHHGSSCRDVYICTECRLKAYNEGRKQFSGPKNPYFGKEWKKKETEYRNQARGVSVCGWCGRVF